MAQQSCSYRGGPFNGGNCPSCSIVGAGNEFVHDPNPFPYDNTPDFYDQPPQPQYQQYSCELCGNDSHYGFDCPPWLPLDSLVIWNKELSTIPEKESDEVIKSSVEDLVLIQSESEDTSDNDSKSDFPFCDNSVTFSNPLFNDNDAFTSSDDESLLEEDVPKENFKIYSNPLFEFDDEHISSDVNPLFNEVLEDIESEDSYVSKLDEPDLLVTPLSKLNEDEYFDSRIDDDDFDPEGDILLLEKLLNDDPSYPLLLKELNFEELKVIKSYIPPDFKDNYYDSKRDIIYLESLLIKDTIPNLPPEVFLDHDPRSLEDEPDKDDLKNTVKDCPDYEDSRARGFVHRSL
ncbi:hypothetical protein Tco_0917310, partial [Tanacetum coccineum]